MAGFQGFIVTQFVTFESTGDMTGGCSARADVSITACVHGELDDKVRTTEIKIGIFLIYVALALNLLILTLGQLCISEIARIRWLSEDTYQFNSKVQNGFMGIQICCEFGGNGRHDFYCLNAGARSRII